MLTFDEALENAKEIVRVNLEAKLIDNAEKAIGNHKRTNPNLPKAKRTGHLLGNIKVRSVSGGLEVSFPYYAKFLEFGTGIHCPLKRRITPRTAKALAWGKTIGQTKSGKDKKEHVASSTEGMYPAPFIRPTFHADFINIVVDALNDAFRDEVKLK